MLTILLWSGISRINDFSDYHLSISKNAVKNVSESIGQFVSERKRLISVFANKQKGLIKKSALAPLNDEIKSELEKEVKTYFPKYFSFTITDTNGEPYYENIDGTIGDLCLSDIKSFIKNK